MMELGLGALRLSPSEFWAATPREIAAAFPEHHRQAIGRSTLNDLMKQFPD
jgi:uncharacterized phage protein (TIGR02216 family)